MVFSCEFSEMFKNTFLDRKVAASNLIVYGIIWTNVNSLWEY